MLRLFEKNVVDVKAKYLLLETKMRDMETEWWRLGKVARGVEMVLRGLEGGSYNKFITSQAVYYTKM